MRTKKRCMCEYQAAFAQHSMCMQPLPSISRKFKDYSCCRAPSLPLILHLALLAGRISLAQTQPMHQRWCSACWTIHTAGRQVRRAAHLNCWLMKRAWLMKRGASPEKQRSSRVPPHAQEYAHLPDIVPFFAMCSMRVCSPVQTIPESCAHVVHGLAGTISTPLKCGTGCA